MGGWEGGERAVWCGASGGTSRPKRVSLVARTLEVGDTLHLSNGVRRWTGEMAQPDTTTPAPPSLREVKAYLSAARVDFSDCFERTELIERFRAVQLERQVTDVEQMKAKANAAFKRQSYEYAVRMYTDAVLATDALHAVDQSRARSLQVQLLSNRSRAYMELGIPLAAMEDAERCLQLDPAFLKAYHRLAAAHTSLRRFHDASVVLRQALDRSQAADAEHRADLSAKLADVQRELAAAGETAGAGGAAAGGAGAAAPAARPSSEASSADKAAGVTRLLLELSDDLLLEVLCHLDVPDLLAAAQAGRALRRIAAARGGDSTWHRLCVARWPQASDALHRRSLELAKRAGAPAAARGAAPPLPLDWHVLLRERRRLAGRWDKGQHALSTLLEHKGPVYGVRLRGDQLASSSEDGTVKMWNLATGAVTHTLEGHSHGILGIWLDPDALRHRAVSGGFDADIRQWDFGESPRGRCVRTMVGHSGPVVSIEATEERIVSTSFDGTVRVWSWAGQQVACLLAHDGHSSGLALAEGHAYSGGDDGLLKRWDLSTEQCVDVMEGHEGAVWSVAVQGRTLLSASTGGSVILWDPRVPAKRVHHAPRAHNDAIAGLQFDAHKIVSSGFDSLVKIWDLRTLVHRPRSLRPLSPPAASRPRPTASSLRMRPRRKSARCCRRR
eukprot:Transcript_28903.p1 GENE.Transcript_28903~~Transcript_28903.p1  ORF type:complete len:671 (-),score=175.50 Transcript_28903:189-2201(-)